MSGKAIILKLLIIKNECCGFQDSVSNGRGRGPKAALHIYHHVTYKNMTP